MLFICIENNSYSMVHFFTRRRRHRCRCYHCRPHACKIIYLLCIYMCVLHTVYNAENTEAKPKYKDERAVVMNEN